MLNFYRINPKGKQLLLIFLMSTVILQSCNFAGAIDTSDSPPTSKPTDLPAPTNEPDFALYAGFTERKEIPFIILHPSGEKLGVIQDVPSSRNTGVVWISSKGEATVIYTDENGLPITAVIGEDIIQYSNYTESTVDITIVTQDGNRESFQATLDTNLLKKITAFARPSAIPVAYSINNVNPPYQQDLGIAMMKFGLYAFGAAMCIGGIPATSVAPILIVYVAEACAGTILTTVTAVGGIFFDVGWLETINHNLDIAGCMTGNPQDCASLAVTEMENEKKVADKKNSNIPAPPKGQEIAFAVKDGTFTYLMVDGTDPDGQWKMWEKSYDTGQRITLTEGYWWKGTVVLVFDINDVGRRSCVIDNLLEAPESRMAAITYIEGQGCNGEGGSARQLGSEQVLFEYMEAKDGLQLVEAASFAQDATECLRGITEGFTKGLGGKVMVIVACGGASLTLINEILSKYNLQVSDKPIEQPTEPPVQVPNPVSSLRGSVLQLANCRYGPDWPYLFKYGLKQGTKMEVIGRDADGDWLQVQGIGGNNPCWVKAKYMQIEGDVMTLPDAYPNTRDLPISPFFPQMTISVSTSGGMVDVSWQEHSIRSDLETGENVEYIVEIWTCVDGESAFYALGFPPDETSASFPIDNSCGITSQANVIGEDKEGSLRQQ